MRRLANLALLTCVAACGAPSAVPTAVVERGEFSRRVLADGYLKAAVSTPLSAPQQAQGPLRVNWIAADGAFVHAGDVVARFDDTPWTKELIDARGDRSSAALKTAKHDVEARTSAVTAGLEAELARGELRQAERYQATDEELYSRHERIESELDAQLARERESHALGVQDVKERVQNGEGELLRIERQKAESGVERAERALAALELRADHDGLLILVRDWRGSSVRPGDTVWPGQAIAEVPQLETMEVDVFVLEADAGGLAAGQSARVTVEARPDRAYDATVKRVDKVARPRARRVPVQYFGATLSLTATDREVMKPGQRVRADIAIDTLKDVLVVARQAVFDRDGRKIVYRLAGRRFEPREVQVAASSGGQAVLSSGVAAGDVLALVEPQAAEPPPKLGTAKADS